MQQFLLFFVNGILDSLAQEEIINDCDLYPGIGSRVTTLTINNFLF